MNGYCHCGCGRKTTLAKMTSTRDGTIKGQPVRYVRNHHTRFPRKPAHFGTLEGLLVAFMPLQNGMEAIVDRADYEEIKDYSWDFDAGYARAWVNGKKVRMQHLILKNSQGLMRDHKNLNTLDNRRSNLRIASRSQNLANTLKKPWNKSGYKGVCKVKDSNRWLAQIRHEGIQYYLGHFMTPEEAHTAYCEAGRKLHGEFFRV